MSDRQRLDEVINSLIDRTDDIERLLGPSPVVMLLKEATTMLHIINNELNTSSGRSVLAETPEGQIIPQHGVDRGSAGLTTCCHKNPMELPHHHRLTMNQETVNCNG